MNLDWIRRDKRANALLAAPAFALALAACGGGANDVSSNATNSSAPTSVEVDETSAPATDASASDNNEDADNNDAASDSEADATDDTATPTTEAASGPAIVRLSADEAIANAEVNQPTLQPAENVLDIQTLAVADGSVQTLRDVVVGDRPVLLWFFSPH